MANPLDLFRPKDGRKTVAAYAAGKIGQPLQQKLAQKGPLPRAAAIYGAAAAVFAVITIFYLFRGLWFTGLIMILPTLCLGAFAWHYMRD